EAALTGPAGSRNKLVALDQLSGFYADLAHMGIETFPPVVFKLQIAVEAAALVADFHDPAIIHREEVAARLQPKVHANMPFERNAIVAILGIVIRMLSEELKDGRGRIERRAQVDPLRLIDACHERLGHVLIFHKNLVGCCSGKTRMVWR